MVLPYGVMVAHQFLALLVWVRILVRQQYNPKTLERSRVFYALPFA